MFSAFVAAVILMLTGADLWANSATVLSFTGPTDRPEVPQAFYGQLRAQIEFSTEIELNDVPEQSLNDLLMAVGCIELDGDCSDIIRDVLGSDLLAWGEFEELEGGGVRVNMFLWNLAEGRMERERTHDIPEGGEVAVGLAAMFSRSVLSSRRPTLVVESSTPNALVFVDGELMGAPPIEMADLSIGRYEVRVEAPGTTSRAELVEVDVDGATLSWALEAAVVARTPREPRAPREGNGNGLRYASMGAAGVGAVLLVVGVVSGVASNSTQQDFDDEVARPVFDLDRAQSLQDQGESQARNATIFLATGAALVVAGGVGLIVDGARRQSDSSDGDNDEASNDTSRRRAQWVVAPGWSNGRPAVGASVRF
jgi:hypothetical protein